MNDLVSCVGDGFTYSVDNDFKWSSRLDEEAEGCGVILEFDSLCVCKNGRAIDVMTVAPGCLLHTSSLPHSEAHKNNSLTTSAVMRKPSTSVSLGYFAANSSLSM